MNSTIETLEYIVRKRFNHAAMLGAVKLPENASRVEELTEWAENELACAEDAESSLSYC